MRTITLSGGSASIEGDKVTIFATQEGSNEVVKVEIPVAVLSAMQDAAKKAAKKGGGE